MRAIDRLRPSLMKNVSYVGSHSSHLTETLNLNPRPVGGTSTTPFRLNAIAATVTKPFPGCTAANCPLFSTVQQDLQDIDANYKSFQISVEKRSTRGLTILANYTWSRSTDDLPPGAGVLGFDTSSARPWDDPLRHQLDWGPSEFDHTIASWGRTSGNCRSWMAGIRWCELFWAIGNLADLSRSKAADHSRSCQELIDPARQLDSTEQK